jgi:CubicO group peptidase (beta-lactamase class C family)
VLRDYARLGLLLAHGGQRRGRQVIPAGWLEDATSVRPDQLHLQPGIATPFFGYGYQTWIFPGQQRRFALLGVRGRIRSVDDRAAAYEPALAGTEYGRTSLRDLLQMSSGVRFVEEYSGRDDVSMLATDTFMLIGAGGVGVVRSFNTRAVPAGTKFSYASVETQVLGLVLRRAVGLPVADYLHDPHEASQAATQGPRECRVSRSRPRMSRNSPSVFPTHASLPTEVREIQSRVVGRLLIVSQHTAPITAVPAQSSSP